MPHRAACDVIASTVDDEFREWGVCAVDVDVLDGVSVPTDKELQAVRIAVHDGGSRRCGKCDAVDVDIDVGQRPVGGRRHAHIVACTDVNAESFIIRCVLVRYLATSLCQKLAPHQCIAPMNKIAVLAAAIAAMNAGVLSYVPDGSAPYSAAVTSMPVLHTPEACKSRAKAISMIMKEREQCYQECRCRSRRSG